MRIFKTAALGGLMTVLTACTTGDKTSPSLAAGLNNKDLYEVHHDGRIHVFDDRATYEHFLEVGETSYRQTFIGAGPKGETLVFGVTGADKKKRMEQVAGYNLYHGMLPASQPFYGETRLDGRIYVFDRLEDMEAVRKTGEAPLRFTQIGAGPAGETVVFVLNSDNKKHKPDALMAAFRQHNR
ncbi:hypothetical protein [Marinobacterium weihaiense]|uniref:Lipoprotein n=1 Tax=Marinobacterium weihaiense TaxID=2851016 RepID=A0ABS6MFC0_9GAMM|nr:hypothetical protein [Marinobacterium weihaiense]MBV0934427.1 hypothetical protein [Marinobacterium weihaiense]